MGKENISFSETRQRKLDKEQQQLVDQYVAEMKIRGFTRATQSVYPGHVLWRFASRELVLLIHHTNLILCIIDNLHFVYYLHIAFRL